MSILNNHICCHHLSHGVARCRRQAFLMLLLLMSLASAVAQTWPKAPAEAKAGTRWWWLGSAVDRAGLEWNLGEYARVGIGAVEITPLYGVQGNERNELSFLSPAWMSALRTTEDIARENGIQVDMNCGTGWPFGGPLVPIDEAACKAVFHDSIVEGKHEVRFELGRTRQKVKRAAPGGEGWVIDHFDRQAVKHYLQRFDSAFAASGVPYPNTFFNDSYEVYGADWTPTLFDEFMRRRGYDLRNHLPELLGYVDDGNCVLADYRETLSDMLLENFTEQWVAWAHQHGVRVRNQAHGSPANLLDLYAAVDIPEIEGFGLSEFGIKGLRTDPGMTRKNFSDVSMLKYASSAAHVTGKPLMSSETFTWLTEHFRTSLSQMKPDLDLMFTCGVNHVYFHGSCYTPKDDPWPGWKFYASIDMSPTNSIWRDAPYLMQYIERCQTFLQMGQPDNDFLVYLPVRDMWRKRGKSLLLQFEINSMDEKAPEFISSILKIDSLGYDCDYISDRQLAKVTVKDGRLVTEGGTCYRGLIIPTGTTVDDRLAPLLAPLADYVVYGEDEARLSLLAKAEDLRARLGLRAIRRSTSDGYHYFIANLTPRDVCSSVALSVGFKSAMLYDPMSGTIKPAALTADGRVNISLRSGQSCILKVTDAPAAAVATSRQQCSRKASKTIDTPWTLTFIEESPHVSGTFRLDSLQTWETLSDSAAVTMGTGVYETTFTLTKKELQQLSAAGSAEIDLGDVRESARVYLNGQLLGCAWAVPYVLSCGDLLRKGTNQLRIEVTNLPANRIADMDCRGIAWRKMKEINVVDLNYKKTTYASWAPVPSGMRGPVVIGGGCCAAVK